MRAKSIKLPRDLRGSDEKCRYYPCHFKGQDCTWCFCPFYPCLDNLTGGKFVVSSRKGSKVWSCIECRWVHEPKVSKAILEQIKSYKDVQKLRTKLLGGKK